MRWRSYLLKIPAIGAPLKSRMPSLLGRRRTLRQVRRTFSIPQWFDKGAEVPYPRGRKAKDCRLAGTPFTGLTKVSRCSGPHYRRIRWGQPLRVHALKLGKLRPSANPVRIETL